MASWPTSCGGEAKRINFLEHVVLEIALNFTLRRNIEIEVISPNGTKSIILRSGRLNQILSFLIFFKFLIERHQIYRVIDVLFWRVIRAILAFLSISCCVKSLTLYVVDFIFYRVLDFVLYLVLLTASYYIVLSLLTFIVLPLF